MKRLDLHVHIVGNGSGGTGCWLRRAAWQWPLHALMLRHIGLPVSALNGDLDRPYVQRLLELVQTSSLDAAVILAQEQVYDEQGRPMENRGAAYVPNEYVLRLAREHREFLPAVAIHPARPDALEELERCLAGGAVMLKLLPNCQNVDCSDPRFTPFWERLAEAGMPFLAHTGGEHTLPIVRPEFADPRVLRRPLECGVTVIAAHAATKSGLTDPEYFDVLVEMFGAYPRLFADNSALNIPIRSRVIPRCLEEPVLGRLVHGSDYPVPIFGHWAWMRGFIDRDTLRRCQQNPNVLERDCELKRAMGFPEETFTRGLELLRATPAVQALRSAGGHPVTHVDKPSPS